MASTLTQTSTAQSASSAALPELFLRSVDATWDEARWETLDHDSGYRYEVIDGVLYMSTSPSLYHQWISGQTSDLLKEQLQRKGLGYVLTAPGGLFMPGTRPVQPDIMVLRPEDKGLIPTSRAETIPLLLVEILSPSNANYDLATKRAAYARAGVPEYWILRPVERDVLVHWEPELATGLYLQVRHIMPDGELVSPTLPFRAPVAAFFAEP
jgi:Uma2 family endonuclease